MAKRPVSECICERCERKWYEDAEDADKESPSASIEFSDGKGDTIREKFGLLCVGCKSTVRNYMASILKEPKKETEAKEEEEGATDTAPTPSPSYA